jgi:hypothetical protein
MSPFAVAPRRIVRRLVDYPMQMRHDPGVTTMKSMIALSTLGILCWVVMFLAGTDVWHSAGSPDFWRLAGPPYTDLRAFGYAFYLQFLTLLAMLVVSSCTARRLIRSTAD